MAAEARGTVKQQEDMRWLIGYARGLDSRLGGIHIDFGAPIPLGDSIMMEFMVDSAVMRQDDGVAPQYPASMLKRRIEGSVIVQYVVDTLGRADTATFRVITATHTDFARAVKATLPQMRFRPAIMANKLVPQLVQQPFAFKIQDTTLLRKPPGSRGPG